MSQDRYHRPEGLNSGSLGVSLLITGGMIAGLIFAAPHVTITRSLPVLTIQNIPIAPPPPLDPKPLPKTAKPLPQPFAPRPEVPMPLPQPTMSFTPTPLGPVSLPTPGPIASASPAAEPTAPPLPVLVDAAVDPRYAAALQPPYPAEERRAEREGRVVVRVLIGVDGRVKQVERRSADSDAFYRETERQALGKWRFKPATRDGIPVETWRTMSIRFVLQEG